MIDNAMSLLSTLDKEKKTPGHQLHEIKIHVNQNIIKIP